MKKPKSKKTTKNKIEFNLVLRIESVLSRTQILMHARIISHAAIVRMLLIVTARTQRITHRVLCRRWWHHWRCRSTRRSAHWVRRCTSCFFGSIQICFFLRFADIFLISNAFVTEPIGDLRHLEKNVRFLLNQILFFAFKICTAMMWNWI